MEISHNTYMRKHAGIVFLFSHPFGETFQNKPATTFLMSIFWLSRTYSPFSPLHHQTHYNIMDCYTRLYLLAQYLFEFSTTSLRVANDLSINSVSIFKNTFNDSVWLPALTTLANIYLGFSVLNCDIDVQETFAIFIWDSWVIPSAHFNPSNFCRSYLAACLSQFSSLILLYFGNRKNLLTKVRDTGFSLRTRPLCCCCCCCPTLKSTPWVIVRVYVCIILIRI